MSKLTLLTAAAAGYVLGARAGRERYEQIASTARTVARNPKVQSAKQQTQSVAAEKAAAAGSVAAEKAKQAAATVSEKVGRGDSTGGTHAATPPTPPGPSVPSSPTDATAPQSGTSGPPLS